MPKSFKWSCLILISLGLALWLINWWFGRPLFLDEANVARNLFDRSLVGLFSPLDHRQYAPPLYLVLTKICGELFGYGERALRLPALLGGMLAIIGLVFAGKNLKLGWWTLLPLALIFISPEVIRYVGEIKPYSFDLGISTMLTAMALNKAQHRWSAWVAVGIFSTWLSLPAVFVLAAAGLAFLITPREHAPKKQRRERLIWLAVGTIWLASFALLYFMILRPAIGSSYLNTYHEPYFFPLPQANYPWDRLGDLFLSIPRMAFGFTTVAIFFGSASLVVGWLQCTWFQRTLFSTPLLLVLLASSLGYYSLLPRLLLFILPGLWLLATIGGKHVFESAFLPAYWRFGFVIIWFFVLGGTNVVRHYWQPLTFSDARRLTTEFTPGYTPVLHHGVVPTYDYYQRIHPDTRKDSQQIATSTDIREQKLPGQYVLLYDVLTQGNIRESARRDSTWATARGCKVSTEAMFRAKAVYVNCKN